MDKKFDFDDGDWYWCYDCQSSDPSDYYYTISFETPKGGFLSENEITCNYWKTDNLLQIVKEGGS